MYNLSNHYENIYQHLQSIIADPRVIYLYPFGSTQPENIELLIDNRDPPDTRIPAQRRGPAFIFVDQEPLDFTYNAPLFDYIVNNIKGPYILVNTEHRSTEKDRICDHYGFAQIDYFFHIFAAADWYRGHEYLPGIVAPANRILRKSYISFNRLTSNQRVYRSLLVNELYKQDLLKHGHVSLSKECPDGGSFDTNLTDSMHILGISQELVTEACTNINSIPELRIDFEDSEFIPNQSMLLSPLPKLMESFIFVVTETCYWQDKTHLTEKIFKPIALQMPFILVGCVNNLEYLRSYGFKTFGAYWDESYDTIADPILRLKAIANIIKSISDLSVDEQKTMLLDMQPILAHNLRLFTDSNFVRKEWQHLTNSLTDISQYYKFVIPYATDTKTGQCVPLRIS